MEAILEKGIETAATVAGGKAVRSAMQGRFRKALAWSIPVVMAGVLVWYIRRGERP